VTWEWVSPTAGGLVGLAGVAATYFTGRGSSKQALQVARDNAAHVERMALHSRSQDRLTEAYLTMLELVAEQARWAGRSRRVGTPDEPAPEIGPIPGEQRQHRVWALLAAYGSEVVRTRFEEFEDAVRVIHFADDVIADTEQPERAAKAQVMANGELIANVMLAQERLRRVAAAELAQRPPSDPPEPHAANMR
jgi:hypothetical protein